MPNDYLPNDNDHTNLELIFTDSYNRRAKKFLRKHPNLISQYEKTLKLLILNPQHPALRLHKLSGKLDNLSSVSINMSYRIILYFEWQDGKIVLVDIGNHDSVY